RKIHGNHPVCRSPAPAPPANSPRPPTHAPRGGRGRGEISAIGLLVEVEAVEGRDTPPPRPQINCGICRSCRDQVTQLANLRCLVPPRQALGNARNHWFCTIQLTNLLSVSSTVVISPWRARTRPTQCGSGHPQMVPSEARARCRCRYSRIAQVSPFA